MTVVVVGGKWVAMEGVGGEFWKARGVVVILRCLVFTASTTTTTRDPQKTTLWKYRTQSVTTTED